jgi:tetratricopeptide (TPR) repeat protein
MKGRYFWNKRTMDSLRKAIEYFEQAIKNDSSYAQAYAGLADCYSLLVNYSQVAPEEGFPKAKAAATQALRLDNAIAEAHASLAKIHHLYDWDWEAAEREFKRALELNPEYATAHQWYGEYLISMGRFDEAKAEMRRALELDPVSIAINIAQGFPFYYAREYDEAITAYRKALELAPNFDAAYLRLNHVYIQKRMYDEAIAAFVAAYADSPRYQEMVKTAYAVSGMKGFWELDVAGPEEGLIRHAYATARNYIHLGEQDKAFKWLEKAYQNRSHNMVDLKVDPAWDDLRADPRFTDLLRRMHLEP